MKILVTGGAGFIGSHVVDALIKRGHDVVVIDNLVTGKKENLNKKAKFYFADIRDRKISEIFKKERPQIVNHHAAHINIRESIVDPLPNLQVNVVGTINLLECCRKFDSKIIFASSSAIYGEGRNVSEKAEKKPSSPYGITKLFDEFYLNFYNKIYGMKYISLRYSNVYGPRQAGGEAGVIAIFIKKMLENKKITIFGNGKQERDFVYVDDVVNANIIAMKKGNGEFNIGTGKSTSINEIFFLLSRLTKYKKKAVYAAKKAGETLKIFLSCEKAKKILGWKPSVSLEEGLKKTVNWFKNAR